MTKQSFHIAVVVALLSGCMPSPDSQGNVPGFAMIPPSIDLSAGSEVSLATLLEDFGDGKNILAAEQKYESRTIRTSGVLTDVGKNIKHKPYLIVSLSAERGDIDLQCFLADSAAAAASSLSLGDAVIVQGRVQASGLGNVLMGDCVFMKSKRPTTEVAQAAVSVSELAPSMQAEPQQAAEEEGNSNPECTTRYRWATAEDYSPDEVARFQSECPGYDLPVAWQEAGAVEPEAVSVSGEVTACVDEKAAAYRAEIGEDAMVRADMLAEWEAECSAGRHTN